MLLYQSFHFHIKDNNSRVSTYSYTEHIIRLTTINTTRKIYGTQSILCCARSFVPRLYSCSLTHILFYIVDQDHPSRFLRKCLCFVYLRIHRHRSIFFIFVYYLTCCVLYAMWVFITCIILPALVSRHPDPPTISIIDGGLYLYIIIIISADSYLLRLLC